MELTKVPATMEPNPPAMLPTVVETAMYIELSSGGLNRVTSLMPALFAAAGNTPPTMLATLTQSMAVRGVARSQMDGSRAQKK